MLHPVLDHDITKLEVKNALCRIANSKAPGANGIKNEHLKHLPSLAVAELHKMISKIWEAEKPPIEWSQAETIMIFKKGDRNDPNNYRPIALLSTQAKLFTSIIHNRLYDWVENNGIRPKHKLAA